MVTIRAPDEFPGLMTGPSNSGVLRWGRGFGDAPVHEGDEFEPHESVASIETADFDISVGVDTFGRITKLLVAEGATVVPGQALLEYEERAPTMEEWQAESDRASKAERRARDADQKLDSPLGALRAAIKRRTR